MIDLWVTLVMFTCIVVVAIQNFRIVRAINKQMKKYEDVVNDNMTNWTNPNDTKGMIQKVTKRKPVMVNELRAEEELKREQGWS